MMVQFPSPPARKPAARAVAARRAAARARAHGPCAAVYACGVHAWRGTRATPQPPGTHAGDGERAAHVRCARAGRATRHPRRRAARRRARAASPARRRRRGSHAPRAAARGRRAGRRRGRRDEPVAQPRALARTVAGAADRDRRRRPGRAALRPPAVDRTPQTGRLRRPSTTPTRCARAGAAGRCAGSSATA